MNQNWDKKTVKEQTFIQKLTQTLIQKILGTIFLYIYQFQLIHLPIPSLNQFEFIILLTHMSNEASADWFYHLNTNFTETFFIVFKRCWLSERNFKSLNFRMHYVIKCQTKQKNIQQKKKNETHFHIIVLKMELYTE